MCQLNEIYHVKKFFPVPFSLIFGMYMLFIIHSEMQSTVRALSQWRFEFIVVRNNNTTILIVSLMISRRTQTLETQVDSKREQIWYK